MCADKDYGVPSVKSKITKNDSGSYDMDNVTCENLPAFKLEAGTASEYNINNLEEKKYGRLNMQLKNESLVEILFFSYNFPFQDRSSITEFV